MNGFIQITTLFTTILYSQCVYLKVLNYTKLRVLKYIAGILFSVLLTFGIFMLRDLMPNFRFALLILSFSAFAGVLTNTRYDLALTTAVLAVGVSYGAFLSSAFVSSLIINFLYPDGGDIIAMLVTVALQGFIVINLFRIKRFSKGIPFLMKKGAGVIGLVICSVITFIFMLINRGPSAETGAWLLVSIALCSTGLIIWWRHGMTRQYREKVEERAIQELERTITEKDCQLKELKEDNDMMASIIHRDNKLLPAMAAKVLLFMKSEQNISPAGMQILRQTEQLIEERAGSLKNVLSTVVPLQTMTNPVIDGVLNYMMVRASEKGIRFEIAELSDFVESGDFAVSSIKLQTILADLIENAINATVQSELKRILISFNVENGIHEFCVQDSGIPFEVETIIDLGVKKTTTGYREGGSGIGYMTTFEILHEYDASLIITEYEPERSDFTKSITVRFDGRAELLLLTHRAEDINKICSKNNGSGCLLKILPI